MAQDRNCQQPAGGIGCLQGTEMLRIYDWDAISICPCILYGSYTGQVAQDCNRQQPARGIDCLQGTQILTSMTGLPIVSASAFSMAATLVV